MTRLLRHWLVAWGRNLAANRLLSAIATAGLVIGLAGAILMALVARVPLTYNHIVPEHERTYIAASIASGPGMAPDYQQASPGGAAALIEANVPEVEAAARLLEAEVELRRDGAAHKETIYWADPEYFDLARLPVLGGDLASALRSGHGLVMTEAMARKHFGRADALGETIDVAGQPMVLRAVIADLPPGGTDLTAGIFALRACRAFRPFPDASRRTGHLFHHRANLHKVASGRFGPEGGRRDPAGDRRAGAAAHSQRLSARARPDRPARPARGLPSRRARAACDRQPGCGPGPADRDRQLRQSERRTGRGGGELEIGVRKANGAGRGHIAGQFLAEAVLTVLLATALALAAAEWLLPVLNGFLETQARLDYAADPTLLLWLLSGAVLLGLAAGAYPAFLLSSLPPVATLRDSGAAAAGGGLIRSVLVTGQFAILIGLIIATSVVHQQRLFAMREALRMDIDKVLTVTARCPPAFVAESSKLPGVRAVSCSSESLLSGNTFAPIDWKGDRVMADIVSVLPSIFALYRVRPVAGSLAALPPQGRRRRRE